jgi:glycosyltransferase involved in cell wall biosynthesis
LRILHIIPSLRKGGAERLTIDICRELSSRKGIRVVLLLLHDEQAYPFLTEGLDIRCISSRVTLSVWKENRFYLEELSAIITDFKPDVIHSHLFEAEIVSRALPVNNVRYFTHCHDNMVQLRRLGCETLYSKRSFTNFYERKWLMNQYKICNNHFIVVSKDSESYYKTELPSPLNTQISLLPNAIVVDRFRYLARKKLSAQVRLVSCGSLNKKKNHDFLLEVVAFLKRSNPDIHLTIVGDGPLKVQLSEKIQKLELATNVTLAGQVDKPEHYYQEADIYVHSALIEPFGLVLIEAMASGLPVITLDGKGNRDLIVEGKNGYLITNRDPATFAKRVSTLAGNPDQYMSMSEYAVQYANAFDIRSYVDRLLSIYSLSEPLD